MMIANAYLHTKNSSKDFISTSNQSPRTTYYFLYTSHLHTAQTLPVLLPAIVNASYLSCKILPECYLLCNIFPYFKEFLSCPSLTPK